MGECIPEHGKKSSESKGFMPAALRENIDTGVVGSLKVLDPDGRLENRTFGQCRP